MFSSRKKKKKKKKKKKNSLKMGAPGNNTVKQNKRWARLRGVAKPLELVEKIYCDGGTVVISC